MNLKELGLSSAPKRATLQEANEIRDYRIYETFAYKLITKARKLYIDDPEFTLELDGVAYALDSTTIELCMALFPWAKFRTTKAGIKLHTLLDFQGNIPAFIHITDARIADVKVLDIIVFERGAFYVMDRGYLDFERLYTIHVSLASGTFFQMDQTTFERSKFLGLFQKCRKEKNLDCDGELCACCNR